MKSKLSPSALSVLDMDASAASQTDFAILWRQATDGFDQKCGIPLREICLPAPQKPGDLIRSIDQHHQHFEEYIKRGEEIRAVLKSVLRPVGFFSDIVAAGASVVSVARLLVPKLIC